MKNNLKLEEAISRLADLFEYGHLQAECSPADFIDTVTARIKELEEDFTAKDHGIAELEQALRAEIDHSKQLVADCRTCKLVQKLEAEVISLQTVAACSNCGTVQELEKSIQWYVDFANAQGKILTDEIQRANLAESLVDNLRSEVNAFQNDLALEKEGNKRYRSQLARRNGLVPADKAIK